MRATFMSQAKFPMSTRRAFVTLAGDCYSPSATWTPRPVYTVPRPGVDSTPVTLAVAHRNGWRRPSR